MLPNGKVDKRWGKPHIHLRPDEDDTPPEEYFTAANVARYRGTADAAGIAELGIAEHIHRFAQALDVWRHPFWVEQADLKLSNDQGAKIKALLEAFDQANKADIEALAKIGAEAKAAAAAGKSREEIAAILARGNAIRVRLEAAEKALQTAIENVLTAAQKAWLDANQPKRCEPGSGQSLTMRSGHRSRR